MVTPLEDLVLEFEEVEMWVDLDFVIERNVGVEEVLRE